MISLILLFCILPSINACRADVSVITYHEQPRDSDSLVICEGIICQTATLINYISLNGTEAQIEMSEPVMVAMADQKEKWGYFQFPGIGRAEDGTLIVTWTMKGDTYKMYGRKSPREMTPMMSKDRGRSWVKRDRKYVMEKGKNDPILRNGSRLSIHTPTCKNIRDYDYFPKPVGQYGDKTFFPMDSLPNELQGLYINIYKNNKHNTIHSRLNDPGLLRYAIDNLMPILWRGDIRQLADQSLVAGVYPCYYLDTPGGVAHCGVSFYRSIDEGKTWDVISRIPFKLDGIAENRGGLNFEEPAFEILEDSTFICVMRTGSKSPMYQTFSGDKGKTWTDPKPFTPNGVRPRLLKLNNGVLVLVSGRPGVQVRFSLDGTGTKWTDPIEMNSFVDVHGKVRLWKTCGYAYILEESENSFYIVYSDFTTPNSQGEARKSIWCRKVAVNVK